MKIVFVNTSRIWGGNEKWTCESAAGLKARGHDIRLIGQSALMAAKAASYGVDFSHLRLRGDGDILGVIRLARRFAKLSPDAVILTKPKEYWLGGIAAKLAGIGKIYFRIGIDRPVQRNIKYRLLFGRICDMFVVNAETVKTTLLEAPFIGPERITVIKNGVGLDGASSAGPDFLSSLGIPSGATIVGATGRLAKQKGFDVLIKAFSVVRRECPQVFLVIAGEGHDRERLTALIQRLELSDAVSLPGFVENMGALYSSLTVFALPSRFEGMPNVLLEAMAAKVPVVACDVSGVGELIRDGETGHLVPAEDPDQLARKIVDVLLNDRRETEMTQRARRLVESQYSVDRMVDDLERMLRGGPGR